MIDSLKAELRDLPQAGQGRRWTAGEQSELKRILNSYGLLSVSDCIGSLQFDLIDAKHERERLLAERDLLVSRLCAIAFEAGMGGGWRLPEWEPGTGAPGTSSYWTLTRVRPVLTVSEMNLPEVK